MVAHNKVGHKLLNRCRFMSEVSYFSEFIFMKAKVLNCFCCGFCLFLFGACKDSRIDFSRVNFLSHGAASAAIVLLIWYFRSERGPDLQGWPVSPWMPDADILTKELSAVDRLSVSPYIILVCPFVSATARTVFILRPSTSAPLNLAKVDVSGNK